MANPTTNYGFVLPTASDLVTDLPADFDVALQGVDTRLKALQPGTTSGDLAYSSATANTNVRLPIGTAGQVLAVSGGVPAWTTTADVTPLTTKGDLFTFTTVDARLGVGADGTTLVADSSTATGLKWSAPGGGANYSLINAGGTNLSGSETTISGISNAEYVQILIQAAQCNSAGAELNVLINNDTGGRYDSVGANFTMSSSFSTGMFSNLNSIGDSRIRMGQFSNTTGSSYQGGVIINGGKSSGGKAFYNSGMGDAAGSNNQGGFFMTGVYRGTAAITSVTLRTQSGSFTAGKIYVYTSA